MSHGQILRLWEKTQRAMGTGTPGKYEKKKEPAEMAGPASNN
jgi:hypothetical protein